MSIIEFFLMPKPENNNGTRKTSSNNIPYPRSLNVRNSSSESVFLSFFIRCFFTVERKYSKKFIPIGVRNCGLTFFPILKIFFIEVDGVKC